MIRIECPSCSAALKIPDELAGSKGRCPTCRGVVEIPAAQPPASVPATVEKPISLAPAEPAADDGGLTFKPPDRLGRKNHYLICNSRDVVATWQDDGRGWMVRVKDGFVKASQNPTQLPSMGNFVLIEIVITTEDFRQRLAAVNAFRLEGDFVMT